MQFFQTTDNGQNTSLSENLRSFTHRCRNVREFNLREDNLCDSYPLEVIQLRERSQSWETKCRQKVTHSTILRNVLTSNESMINLTIKKWNGLFWLIKAKCLWSKEFNVLEMCEHEIHNWPYTILQFTFQTNVRLSLCLLADWQF